MGCKVEVQLLRHNLVVLRSVVGKAYLQVGSEHHLDKEQSLVVNVELGLEEHLDEEILDVDTELGPELHLDNELTLAVDMMFRRLLER